MRVSMIRTVGLAGIMSAAGCNLLIPFAFIGEHKRKVPAEFSKLDGKKVLVFVWAEPETLFDYPHVRLELATYVADKIRSDLPGTTLVDTRRVEDRLQRTLVTDADPVELGRHFDADMVVYLELLEFQIRDPDAPDFVQARIEASVAVYDIAADPDEPRQYELAPVTTVHPENASLLVSQTNIIWVRQEAYVKFAEMVARKFHPYEEVLD